MVLKLKDAYLIWYKYYKDIPKEHRYTLGQHIDTLFIASLEAVSQAAFLGKDEKASYVRLGIRKIDTIKVLLMILWETKSLDTKKYAHLSIHLDEVGRMLGGWNGQLSKTTPRT